MRVPAYFWPILKLFLGQIFRTSPGIVDLQGLAVSLQALTPIALERLFLRADLGGGAVAAPNLFFRDHLETALWLSALSAFQSLAHVGWIRDC